MLLGFIFEQTKERETERRLIFGLIFKINPKFSKIWKVNFQNSFYIYIYICLKEPVSFNEIN